MIELSAQVLAEEDVKQSFIAAQLRANPQPASFFRLWLQPLPHL